MKAKDGASFLRPTGCTNCESLFGGSFKAEICIEIQLETQEPLFDLFNLETENVCPYNVSSTSFSSIYEGFVLTYNRHTGYFDGISKARCKEFFAHKVPHFKINTTVNGPKVSQNMSQNEKIFVKL